MTETLSGSMWDEMREPCRKYNETMQKIDKLMEEATKYYTPEAEEFHPGFEFEEKYDGANWDKREYIPSEFVEPTGDDRLQPFLNEGVIRVKYLDIKDIESEGFVQNIGTPPDKKYNEGVLNLVGENCYKRGSIILVLRELTNPAFLVIDVMGEDRVRSCEFIGKIPNYRILVRARGLVARNKSEFKAALRLLNIAKPITTNKDGNQKDA